MKMELNRHDVPAFTVSTPGSAGIVGQGLQAPTEIREGLKTLAYISNPL